MSHDLLVQMAYYILMTRHYPDRGNVSDWSCLVGNLLQLIRGATQIWVVMRSQYGISALVSPTSFRGETSGGVAKCRLFSQAKNQHVLLQKSAMGFIKIFR